MKDLETFDLYGSPAINDNDVDGTKHSHKDGDPCHRCDSTNTEISSDSVGGTDGECYWIFLECKDCKLCCVFGGGRS